MTASNDSEGQAPAPGWEGRASPWVVRLTLGVGVGVGLLWGGLSLSPAAATAALGSGQAAMIGAHRKKKQQEGESGGGSDCSGSDCVDCADCADCIDCVDCADGIDCGGLDCGGCDCGGLDCGGLDCACAVGQGATASGGGRCRRGARGRGALVLGLPVLLFAAWQRLPQRAKRREGRGLSLASGVAIRHPRPLMEVRMVSSHKQARRSRSVVLAWLLGAAALGACAPRQAAPPVAPAASAPAQVPTAEAPVTPPPVSTFVAPLVNPVSVQAPVTDIAGLVERLRPTVVNITTSHVSRSDPHEGIGGMFPFRQGPERRSKSLGTGFIVDPAGFIVTNAHVVAGADDIQVKLSDEREFPAKLIGKDTKLDLALLKLENAGGLSAAVMGDSEQVRVGDWVVAIGNPFGLGHTVTLGIASALGRSIGAGPYDAFIQTDASINPGNSGGPLFNLKGEVVGIPTAIRQGAQGIGFAVPVNALKEVLPQLRDKGSVSRGKLGVRIQPLTNELALSFGLPKARGALISNIEPNSAGSKAGISPGDVITHVNGLEVAHADDLPRMVARHQPGAKIKLTVVRGGKTQQVEATLDPLLDDPDDEPSPTPGTKPPSPEPQSRLGIQIDDAPSGGGARIRVVAPASIAAGQLLPGDVIVEVNKQPIRSAADVMKRTENVAPNQVLLLKVRRGTEHRFVALKVK